MNAVIPLNTDTKNNTNFLPTDFNKKKFTLTYSTVVSNPNLQEIQNLGKKQCLGKTPWPEINNIQGWMITSETASFMKWGGLGMVASELHEAFNECFGNDGHALTIVTPIFFVNTGKKKATLTNDTYEGAEHQTTSVTKIKTITVPFFGDKNAVSLIEWWTNIRYLLPKKCIFVDIKKTGEEEREITIDYEYTCY